MQNSTIFDIYFYDNIKDDLKNFESSTLRKNLKASLELNNVRYLTNPIDENIEVVAYLNYNDLNRFNYFKGKDFKKITFAFFSEFESDFKILNLKNEKGKIGYQIKENVVKNLNQFDMIFVPSLESKNILLENRITKDIEILLPPIKRTKFELKDKETKKLVYIYFHLEENSKYVYTFLDSKDESAAKRILEFARIFSNTKIIVLIPNFHKKEAKAVNKYFKRVASNVYACPIIGEDIYSSLVYNAFAYINLNSTYSATIETLEAFTCGVDVFSLKSAVLNDILIDKENGYVYNEFDQLIAGFNDFLVGKLPSLKEKEIEFIKKNDIKKVGSRFIDIYKKYFGE